MSELKYEPIKINNPETQVSTEQKSSSNSYNLMLFFLTLVSLEILFGILLRRFMQLECSPPQQQDVMSVIPSPSGGTTTIRIAPPHCITNAFLGAIIGGNVSVQGIALLCVMQIAKYRRDKLSRENNPFANHLYQALQLSEVSNFKSQKGRQFVQTVDELSNVLKENCCDTALLEDADLKNLAEKLAEVIERKTASKRNLLGTLSMPIEKLTEHMNEVVQEILEFVNSQVRTTISPYEKAFLSN